MFEDILVSGRTDIGLKRENNEDNYLIIDKSADGYDTSRYGKIFVVADGMGGHAAGETASRMACEGLQRYYRHTTNASEEPATPEQMTDHLENIFHDINKEILIFADENEGYEGMGTTLSAIVLFKDKVLIAHVGDSRIYRFRDGLLEQLTVDHTEVQALIDMGRLKPERAATHPRRNILTQAMGVDDELEEVYTRIEDVHESDIFLLCSDGLHDMVGDEEILHILQENPVPQAACNRLIDRAIEQGGKDNVTVVVVRIS